jgi:hypothetical protein
LTRRTSAEVDAIAAEVAERLPQRRRQRDLVRRPRAARDGASSARRRPFAVHLVCAWDALFVPVILERNFGAVLSM